jgi:hypothetical protein
MKRATKALVAGIAVVVVIAGGLGYVLFKTESAPPTTCIIMGQPASFLLRVISDSTQLPVAGAQVSAANEPAYCNGSPATGKATTTLITNSTQWYSLDPANNAGYSVVVRYSGQTYMFTAALRPVSTTCATLFVPSGRTNITMTEFQTTCK